MAAVADPAPADEDRYVVTTGEAGRAEDVTFLGADGRASSLGAVVAEARPTWSGEAVVVAGRDSLSRLEADGTVPTVQVLVGGRFADVVVTEDGRVATLVTARDGGEAVLLVTEPTVDLAAGG